MPRKAREEEEIMSIRNDILEEALKIIGDEGYDNLSMRKLGEHLGLSAKTIYNYYSSKEEIYLRVLTRGFELLNSAADEAVKNIDDPMGQLRALFKVYISFGTENPNYYNLMFSWEVPKYTDYIGTVLEQVAREERDVAFVFVKKAEQLVSAIHGKEDITFYILRLWSGLHGIISLCNSHSINEYISDKEHFLNRIMEHMLSELENES